MQSTPEMRAMAERLAAVRYENLWATRSLSEREHEINRLLFFLSLLERAGLVLVEAEDGR